MQATFKVNVSFSEPFWNGGLIEPHKPDISRVTIGLTKLFNYTNTCDNKYWIPMTVIFADFCLVSKIPSVETSQV